MINISQSDFLTEVNRKVHFNSIKEGGLVWYTDGFKINEDTGAGVNECGMKRKLSFSLEQYTIAGHKCMPPRHVQYINTDRSFLHSDKYFARYT
jgi:hypothetical protein